TPAMTALSSQAPPSPALAPPAFSSPALPPAPYPAPVPYPAPAPLPQRGGSMRLVLPPGPRGGVVPAALPAPLGARAPPGAPQAPRVAGGRSPTPGAKYVTGKRFAHFTNKQIHDRIERAGHKILLPPSQSANVTIWTLSSTSFQYVTLARMELAATAESMAQT